MQSLLGEPEIIAALIALAGVLISVFLSFTVSHKQLKVEIQKLEKTLSAQYEEKLVDSRLETYRSLWETLSSLNKDVLRRIFDNGEISKHISDISLKLDNWYETNGLLLSKNAYGRFTRLCSYLDSYTKNNKFDNPADLAEIRQRVWDLRQMLRDDVHLQKIVPNDSNDS